MSRTATVVSDTSVSAPASDRPKWSRMSGSRTANAARSSSSTALRPNSTSRGNVGAPRVIADGCHSSIQRLTRASTGAVYLGLDEHAQHEEHEQHHDERHDHAGDRVEAA